MFFGNHYFSAVATFISFIQTLFSIVITAIFVYAHANVNVMLFAYIYLGNPYYLYLSGIRFSHEDMEGSIRYILYSYNDLVLKYIDRISVFVCNCEILMGKNNDFLILYHSVVYSVESRFAFLFCLFFEKKKKSIHEFRAPAEMTTH